MPAIKRIVLDVLKPHHPNALELAQAIAVLAPDYHVSLKVTAVDEKTESAVVTVEGNAIDYEGVINAITAMGATVHSIDAVDVTGTDGPQV
jgi:hypothetical protein